MQNSQENQTSSSLNLQSETRNSLFQLLYLINQKHPLRHQIQQALTAANSIIILLIYLSLRQINLFPAFIKLDNQIIILVLFGLLSIVLVQLVLGILYGKQLLIKLQYLIYRNIVFPIALISMIGHTGSLVSPTIVYITGIICGCIVLVLQCMIGKQSFARNLLVQRGFPLSAYVLIFQILLSVYTINYRQCQRFIVVIMLIFSLYYKYTIVDSQMRRSKSMEYTLHKIQAMLNIIYSVFLIYQQLTTYLSTPTPTLQPSFLSQQSYVIIFSLVVFTVLSQFAAQYSDTMKPLPQQFFNPNTSQCGINNHQTFINRIQYIIDDLDLLSNSQNVQIITTSIIPLYYEHISKCSKLQCNISHQIQPHILTNNTHYKTLCSTVFRIVQQLFYHYIFTQCQNINIKLALIKFYLRAAPNKIKILQLISELQKCQLSISNKITIYQMKRCVTDIDVVQFIQSIKIEDSFHHFNQNVSALMRLLIQYWTQFLEERVDFQKVLQIAQKITPFLNSIQMQIQQTIEYQTYSTIRIMKIYGQYLRWIMNDQIKSAMISDYVHLLNKKMSQIHQINCINADMEMGLIAISLQVKKLGEIKMANNQAANIFNYSKQQFTKINVNSIMPSIFAKFHDDFLKAFLINEHKKVNTDRRLIIGKKRQGYLFEIYLQLKKSVITNLQQFIFIANIEVAKITQAPILIICDDKGLITDINSTYKQIFDKSLKRNKLHNHQPYTNIQQLIPSFFQIAMNDITQTKSTIECYDNPVFGIIEIKFDISKISFTQCADAGYIIKGYRIKEPKDELFHKLSLTETLIDTAQQRDLKGMKVQYLTPTNQYLFNQRLQIFGCGQFRSQYTIPYVKLQCFQQILSQNYQTKPLPQYDAQIKTLRFCGDHFQRVQQPQSFQSQITQQLKTKITDIKFNLIKQGIQNQQDSLYSKWPKLFVILIAIVGAILFCTFFVFVSQQKTTQFDLIQQLAKAYQFRGKLAQYVLYFQAQSDPKYGQFFTERKQIIKAQLIDQITQVDLPQSQKQRALKIIYLQQTLKTTKFQQLINDETFQLPIFNKYSLQSPIFTTFKTLIGIFIVIKIVVNLIIMHWHRNKLISILSLFLALPETDIKKSHKKCVQFLKDSNQALNKIEQKISSCQDGTQQTDEQENPHIKIRKFKNISLGKSLVNFLKLNIFNLIFFVLFGIMLFNDLNKNSHFVTQVKLYQFVGSVLPEYSIKMMRSYSKKSFDPNLNINQQFTQKYQTIDFFLAQQNAKGLTIKQNFFSFMLTNQCDKFEFELPQTVQCSSIANGVMVGGVAQAVNLLSSRLNYIEDQPSSSAIVQQLNQLSILLFHLVQPVIQHIHYQQKQQIEEENVSMHLQILIHFILFLTMLFVDLIYLTHYPLHDIAKNIIHSKVLIKLIPQLKKKNKNGYTQI